MANKILMIIAGLLALTAIGLIIYSFKPESGYTLTIGLALIAVGNGILAILSSRKKKAERIESGEEVNTEE